MKPGPGSDVDLNKLLSVGKTLFGKITYSLQKTFFLDPSQRVPNLFKI